MPGRCTASVRTSRFGSDPPALEKYTDALDAYLSKQEHVYLVDFDHDPRSTNDLYGDSLHFNAHGIVEFTKILAGELGRIVEENR